MYQHVTYAIEDLQYNGFSGGKMPLFPHDEMSRLLTDAATDGAIDGWHYNQGSGSFTISLLPFVTTQIAPVEISVNGDTLTVYGIDFENLKEA